MKDLRYALRTFIGDPWFTVVAILTLALGIGANTAVYSAIDAAFFRSLPFPQADALVQVRGVTVPLDLPRPTAPRGSPARTRIPDITDLVAMRDVFTRSAAYATGQLNLSTGPQPVRVEATFVTTEFFSTLRRDAARGRVFTAEETAPGGPNVVVLSGSLWQTQFGGDPAIVGKAITLNAERYEVVGVMPQDFHFPGRAQIWLPLAVPAPMSVMGAFRNFLPSQIVARLADGVHIDVAADRVRSLPRPPAMDRPAQPVQPLQQSLVGDRARALAILMASAALVLLIACANVATLLLSRAAARRRELATLAVLGASRLQILRRLLVESLLLAVAGGALGLAVARWSLSTLTAITPPQLAGVASPQIDIRVLVFTLSVAFLTGLAFGMWPAIGTSRPDVIEALKSDSRGSTRAHHWLKHGLVVAEVTLACLLVIAAGLMIGSLRSLLAVDVGMRVDRVATARLTLPGSYRTAAPIAQFVDSVLGRLRESPGVEHAAAINTLPLAQEQGILLSYAREGNAEAFGLEHSSPYLIVSPGYFRTMGIRLVSGRDFDRTDGRMAPVAVINRTMAQDLWPGEDALGKRFLFGGPVARTVIGIVEDARVADMSRDVGPQAYGPLGETGESYLAIVVRGMDGIEPAALLPLIRDAVRAADPDVPIYAAQSMEAVIGAAVTPRRTNTILLTAFGALALCLALIGVYGVLSYSVAQRTREMGIRMALGAEARAVLTLVIRQGLALVMLGIVLGVAGALATTRYLETMLFGLTPRDPVTFVTATTLFVLVALVACYVPARRATRIDPLAALRQE
jgi:predicted permease